ncbi:class I adenylate-forming enzyme family protein [Nocardia gamkensis]|uniref:AMP-binding protein n=1 Tax=Nocardia gamkensis TaxID=352869 RepID=A0A7X6L148_9NOCA|nr:long-chain fatty acid--CoA ligase [Nocardia gamkensis]NKY25820.1 AMP-binding protein [Nocardia gamkensis]NQE68994.1 4-coumarate--CoA ligase-like 6 [Nocardia gamkensis]
MSTPERGENRDAATRLVARLADGLASYGERPCIEFERRWYSGDEVTAYIHRIAAALEHVGVRPEEPVGIVVRNRVPHAAAGLGFLTERRSIAMINSYQSPAAIARDIEQLRLGAVVADRQDWTAPVVSACARAGSAGIAVAMDTPAVETIVTGDLSKVRDARAVPAVPGLHILTSGTTGPPKRVPIPLAALEHTVRTMTGGVTEADPDDPPELVYWPFGSIGICQLLAAPFLGKRMILLERFTVEEWVHAVKTYRIPRAGVQPTIVRMLLEADVPPEDLASLEYLPGGSGPLEPELRAEFERRYGIPLLWAYGATEFAGSVCAWTPELHERFGVEKAGSVGKPLPGVRVRIVDAETGAEVGAGTPGLLEAEVAALGSTWVRTTDVASVDVDGFVTVHGRADGAINRGGFKILPETVRAALLTHPAVRDACVVGVTDRRLGQVPFAAVQPRRGMPLPSESELLELVRDRLPAHHVPVAIAVVDDLPRNAALKARTDAVAALYHRG